MEFRRALRILSAKWWLIALGAIAGALIAMYAAQTINSRIVPDFEANAVVNYLSLDTEKEGDFNARLGNARSAALGVLEEPGQDVQLDTKARTLTFTAVGSDHAALIATVTRLRDDFLATETDQEGFEAATTAELARLQAQIDEVRTQLGSTASTSGSSIDPQTAAERDQLQFEINSLRQHIASLRVQLAFPDLATSDPDTLQADLDRSQDLLFRLTQGLAALPSETVTETTQSLDTLVLQRHLQDLEARYVSFSLGLLEQPDVIGPISPAFVADNSRDDIGTALAGGSGLLAGALGVIVIVLIADRLRPTLWTVEDLAPFSVTAVIDGGRPGANGRPWYPAANGAPRRRQLQTFRAALDPVVGEASASIGVLGIGVQQVEVQALAADLAVSVAASGTRVLLIDAAFDHPSAMPEYGVDIPTLAGLISGRDDRDVGAAIKRALSDLGEILPDMRALRAGLEIADPADALAGPRLRTLLKTAAELEDLVIMALEPAGEPGSEVLSQRLDHIVLVARSQKTTKHEYRAALEDLSERSAQLAGVALLVGRQSRARRANGRILAGIRGYGRHRRNLVADSTDEDTDLATSSPIDVDDEGLASHQPVGETLSPHNPNPGDGAVDSSEMLVAESTGPAESDPHTSESTSVPQTAHGPEVAGDLRRSVPTRRSVAGRHARTPIERDEGLEPQAIAVDADPGLAVIIDDRDATQAEYRNAEHDLAEVVVELLRSEPAGMISITLEDGEPNAAEALERCILSRDSDCKGMTNSYDEILGGRMSSWRLHRWLEERFFNVHARRADDAPTVWHLRSVNGAFQALVDGESFDAAQVQVLRVRLRRTIDRLARALAEAERTADAQRTESAEAAFNEVRALNQTLFDLWRRWRTDSQTNPVVRYQELRDLGVVQRLDPAASD